MDYSKVEAHKSQEINIKSFLPELGIEQVREEIFNGLLAEKKYISSKFFYDKLGSELFEQITALPEYYPTRTEKNILKNLNFSFIKSFEELNIVEIGSGNHSKISLILSKIPVLSRSKLKYIPLDINGEEIEQSAKVLLDLFPEIKIEGISADFMKQLNCIPDHSNRFFCFFGSTIGNFTSEQAEAFMSNMFNILNSGEYFLVGFDNIKDIETLEKAYNDSKGTTAKFNLNILNAVNGLTATNFNTADFRHVSFFNEQQNRIEMHLEALKDMNIKSKYLSGSLEIKKGETIHTENSYKFDKDLISGISKKANFHVHSIFTDDKNWFSLALFEKL